jgi:hypothetical protein
MARIPELDMLVDRLGAGKSSPIKKHEIFRTPVGLVCL